MKKIFLVFLFISGPVLAQQKAIVQQNPIVATRNIDVKNTTIEGKKQVARAFVKPTLVTSDCMGSSGFGAQGELFGVTLSSSTQSRPCNIRENIKLADSLGLEEFARHAMIAAICEDKALSKNIEECNIVAVEDACEYPTPECKLNRKFK